MGGADGAGCWLRVGDTNAAHAKKRAARIRALHCVVRLETEGFRCGPIVPAIRRVFMRLSSRVAWYVDRLKNDLGVQANPSGR
jgi:hypothetical protein